MVGVGGRWMPGLVPVRSTDGDDEVLRLGSPRTASKGSHHPLTELRGLDPKGFGLWRWALGVGLGVGRWVAPHRPVIGRWVRWVLQGDDDEVSGRDTLRGVSVHRSEAPLTSASRSVGVHFLGVGSLGRWVLGVGSAAGSPPGTPPKRALGRSPAAGFAPPWLVHLSSTSPPPPTSPPTLTSPPPAPKGREREPRAAACPLKTPPGPNGVPTPPI